MPELAEVETVRNVLKKRILHKKIEDVIIIYGKIVENDEQEFKSVLIGNEFQDIKRIGKRLIFELKDHYLLSHLKMEGKYFIKNRDEKYEKHEHVIIRFNDGTDLRYHDTRKFGRMKIIKKEDLYNTKEIISQGIEANSDELTSDYLLDKLKRKTKPIKKSLLDQDVVSGLGNIYVDEVLFASKIHPLRNPKSITKEECERIISSSKRILTKAIEEGGTTIRSYTSSLGVTGNYQNFLQVHKREGKPCPICGTIIKRIKVGDKSTYFCENCQK